jgi:CRP-like cAMP-binding protein
MMRASGRVAASAETLSGIDAFRRLSAAERQQLAVHFACQRYRPGQEIVSYHDSGRDAYFIVSGQVQATIFSVNGKQVALQDLGPGEMFGELSAIDGQPRSAYIVALTDSFICSLTAADFMQAIRDYPAVAEATLKRLTGMVRLLSERVFEVSTLAVKHRIHAELLRLAVQHVQDERTAVILPAPTHHDIANHIGTHREGVTRELANLKEVGLIERRGNALVICDVPRLRAMVRDALGKS